MAPQQQPETSEPELRDYLNVLRRRKWVVVLSALLVTAIATGLSLLQTPIYKGTAEMLVEARTSDSLLNTNSGQRIDPVRAIDTQIQVLKSRPVADKVREKLGEVPAVDVKTVGATDVIRVSAQSTS